MASHSQRHFLNLAGYTRGTKYCTCSGVLWFCLPGEGPEQLNTLRVSNVTDEEHTAHRKDGHYMFAEAVEMKKNVLNAIKWEFLSPSLPQSFFYLENEIAMGSTIVMVGTLDSGSVGRGVGAVRVTVLFSWPRHLTLTAPLSPHSNLYRHRRIVRLNWKNAEYY